MRALRAGIVVVAIFAAACACKQKGTGSGTGTGTGSGTGAGTGGGGDTSGDPAACDGIADKVKALYEANAERTKMTPEEVADNTAMVLAECRAAPNHVVTCMGRVTSVVQLETLCMPKLDDEGSEGLQFEAGQAP
jgi:hypothetical protein